MCCSILNIYSKNKSENDRIELTVFVDNAPAIKVYKKYGFEIAGEQRGAVGMQLLMRRELKGENHA